MSRAVQDLINQQLAALAQAPAYGAFGTTALSTQQVPAVSVEDFLAPEPPEEAAEEGAQAGGAPDEATQGPEAPQADREAGGNGTSSGVNVTLGILGLVWGTLHE
jgi:hypothetical protein